MPWHLVSEPDLEGRVASRTGNVTAQTLMSNRWAQRFLPSYDDAVRLPRHHALMSPDERRSS